MASAPKRLKEAREAAGLNQSELAEQSGIGQDRISRLEGGKRLDGVEAAVFAALAGPLGVRAGWLLTGEPPRYANPVLAVEPGVVAREVVDALREELGALGTGQPKLFLPGRGDEKKRRIRRTRGPGSGAKGHGDKSR